MIVQRNFTGGELAPGLYAGTDLAKYQNGVRTMRNMQIKRSGGVENRPGFEFISEVLDPSKETRLLPFVLSNQSSYVIEMQEETLRFFAQGTLVTKNWSYIVGATKANPCVLTIRNYGVSGCIQSHALTNGCRITISGVSGMTELNGNTYKIKNLTPGAAGYVTVELTNLAGTNIDSSGYTTFTDATYGMATSMTTIISASKASPCVIGVTGHGFQVGDNVEISGISGMTELNGRTFIVGTVTADTLQLKHHDGTNVDSSAYSTYVSGGTINRVLVIPTPYQEAEISEVQYSSSPLRYSSSIASLAFAHAGYLPKELRQGVDGDFALFAHGLTGLISAPVIATLTGSPGTGHSYVVTAVDAYTGEESPPSLPAATGSGATKTLTWSAPVVGTARFYNIYKKLSTGASNGFYGLVGSSDTTSFDDANFDIDLTINPPYERNILQVSGDYPGVIGTYQTRRLFAASEDESETVWASRIGVVESFQLPSPIADDDPVTFTLAGDRYSIIRHLINAGALVMLTNSGEWVINGDQAGTLTPTSINPKQYDFNGASIVRPVVVGGAVVFVQANGSVVKVFGDQGGRWESEDLTLFASHLFDGYEMQCLASQVVPDPIVWVVREDGVLLGLTYIPKQEVRGWHRHDTEGEFLNSLVVPEGGYDKLYVVVNRNSGRFIERMTPRLIASDGSTDAVFLDSHLSYDGRNTNTAVTMTLSGSGWTHADTLTLTCNAAVFSASDVGNEIHITGPDGDFIRCSITAYTDTQHVSVRPDRDVPVSMQAVAISDWATAVDVIGNLWHLEGEDVAVIGDDQVVANPFRSDYTTITVENGEATLDRCYSVIHAGLPYISDLETLDIDTPQGNTIADKNILVHKVTLKLEKTRGLFVGPRPPSDDDVDPMENLFEPKIRNAEGYDDAVDLFTGDIDQVISGRWSKGGRVFLRQIDPLPLTVLAVSPHVTYSRAGG